jgi:SPP1 gp7 family putative phage head morphogenesis protein
VADIPDDPVQFEEAIRAIRARVPMTDEEFDQLVESEREFAFTVAGVAELDLVADVYERVETAVREGTPFEEFQDQVGPDLEETWGGEQPGRVENIFRTNVMGAYSAGRYEAATAPDVLEERPYWRFDGIKDDRQTEICRACNGVILPADHPWWRTHYPGLHFGCRSIVTTLTKAQAEKQGITADPPSIMPEAGFGAPPAAAGSDWEPDIRDAPAPLQGAFAEKEADEG